MKTNLHRAIPQISARLFDINSTRDPPCVPNVVPCEKISKLLRFNRVREGTAVKQFGKRDSRIDKGIRKAMVQLAESMSTGIGGGCVVDRVVRWKSERLSACIWLQLLRRQPRLAATTSILLPVAASCYIVGAASERRSRQSLSDRLLSQDLEGDGRRLGR